MQHNDIRRLQPRLALVTAHVRFNHLRAMSHLVACDDLALQICLFVKAPPCAVRDTRRREEYGGVEDMMGCQTMGAKPWVVSVSHCAGCSAD
eukprot:COSAG01_NODE_3897_length_5564_cov_3.198429_6_plen_92_part_00